MGEFEVHGNTGGAIFTNEADAITALWLIGTYENIIIDRETVKRALDKDGYFEDLHLSIKKVD